MQIKWLWTTPSQDMRIMWIRPNIVAIDINELDFIGHLAADGASVDFLHVGNWPVASWPLNPQS